MRHASWLSALMVVGLAGLAAGPVAAAPAGSAGAAAEPQVDVAKLGAPVYPGAVLDDDYGPNKYKSKDGQTDAHFISKDAFAKVYAFYKAHMPAGSAKPYTDPMSGAKFEIGEMSDPNYIAVSLMVETDQDGKPDGTQIDIVHFVDQP